MSLALLCPKCHGNLDVDDSRFGATVTCTACGHEFFAGSTESIRRSVKDGKPTCPKCHTEDVMRCTIAYAQGTTTHRVSATALGMGLTDEGLVPALGCGSANVTSRSLMATACAPPKAPPNRTMICGVLGLLSGGIPAAICSWRWCFASVKVPCWQLVALVCIGLPFVGMVIGLAVADVLGDKPERQHEKAMEKWSRTWVCQRCGNYFEPWLG